MKQLGSKLAQNVQQRTSTPDNGTPELLMLMLSCLCSPAVLIASERRECVIFSARSFAFKAGASLASGFAGVTLDLIEFPRGAAAGEVQADVVYRLGLVAGPITSVIGLRILLFYLSYRLDRQRVAEIQVELNARRQASG